jgi:uncharacterized repeat protein (TIGR01451 family)
MLRSSDTWLRPGARLAGAAVLVAASLLWGLWPIAAAAGGAGADLSLTFTHFPNPGTGLRQLIYTVHVANAGPGPATSITVVNTLPPAGAYFDNAGGVGWDCGDPVGGVVACTLPSLASGATAPFLSFAVIPAPEGGTLVDTATVSAAEADPAPANNTATDSALVNPAPPLSFYTLTPCRVVDTRDAPGPWGGPALEANSTRQFVINTPCGIPPVVRGVALNVTAVGASDVGDLRLYPSGLPAPGTSTINFKPGQVRANNASVPVINGFISVQCDMPPGSTGTVHLVLDVTGYFVE